VTANVQGKGQTPQAAVPLDPCGCGLDDIAPCGDGPYPQCKPAKARTLGEGEYIGDCGPGETAYFVVPNAKVQAAAPQAQVACNDELCGNGSEVGAGGTAVDIAQAPDIHAELTMAAFHREIAK